MRRLRRRPLLAAAPLAALSLAALTLALPPAATAATAPGPTAGLSSGPAGAPSMTVSPRTAGGISGPFYICANEGNGLCLQDNGEDGSLIANDNIINSGSGVTKQGWWVDDFNSTTTNTFPFKVGSGLNTQVANGREVLLLEAEISASGAGECFDWTDNPVLEDCVTNGSNPYQILVASGSGRLIDVGASDAAGKLVFLKSSGVNSGNPTLVASSGNVCPGACWGGF
jgi:hypothetical protein